MVRRWLRRIGQGLNNFWGSLARALRIFVQRLGACAGSSKDG